VLLPASRRVPHSPAIDKHSGAHRGEGRQAWPRASGGWSQCPNPAGGEWSEVATLPSGAIRGWSRRGSRRSIAACSPTLVFPANIEVVVRRGDGRKSGVRGRDAQQLPGDLFVKTGLDDRVAANDGRRAKPQTPWWRRTPLDPWNVPMRVQLVACLPIVALVLALWLLPKLFAADWGWHTAEPWAGLLALLYWPPPGGGLSTGTVGPATARPSRHSPPACPDRRPAHYESAAAS
jgi:hypothetical protein